MWQVKIIDINGNFQKVVYDSDVKNIVFIAEDFSERFINNIIDMHNKQVSKAYTNGLKDGAEIKRK